MAAHDFREGQSCFLSRLVVVVDYYLLWLFVDL